LPNRQTNYYLEVPKTTSSGCDFKSRMDPAMAIKVAEARARAAMMATPSSRPTIILPSYPMPQLNAAAPHYPAHQPVLPGPQPINLRFHPSFPQGPPPPISALPVRPVLPPALRRSVAPHRPKTFQSKVFVGCPFRSGLKEAVTGPNGSYLAHIAMKSGALVTLHGRGSGTLDFGARLDEESPEPLHVQLSAVRQSIAESLIKVGKCFRVK